MLDWLALAALFAAVGALAGAPGLLLIAGITLAYGALTRIWTRYGMERVQYRRLLGTDRAVSGDVVPLDVTIWNRKALPLPWIAAEDAVTDGIGVAERGQLERDEAHGRRTLHNAWSLTWFERVTRHFHLVASRRGVFEFGPVRLSVRDILGRGAASGSQPAVDRLVVGPRVVGVRRSGRDVAPIGDRRAQQSLFADPALFGGVRPFQAGDPLKRVHWRASARLGRTVSRRYEPARGRQVVIVLDVQTLENQPHWEMTYDDEAFESLCVATASLARRLLSDGASVGLAAASFSGSSERLAFLPAQASHGQLTRLSTLLARLAPISSAPLERLLAWLTRRVPPGTSLLICSVRDPSPFAPMLARMRRSGYELEWLALGEEAAHNAAAARRSRLQGATASLHPPGWENADALVIGR